MVKEILKLLKIGVIFTPIQYFGIRKILSLERALSCNSIFVENYLYSCVLFKIFVSRSSS